MRPGGAATATADRAASSPRRRRRRDLPSDLLGDISRHLHDAADYIRFHAVCKSWRDSLPPAASRRRPAFLPWLLAPPDAAATGRRRARHVLSPDIHPSILATEICDLGRTWVTRLDDGVAYWFVADDHQAGSTSNSSNLVNPLTGSVVAALPRFPDEMASWVGEHASGVVSGNGTIVLYALYPPVESRGTTNMALLRPGDTVWTSVRMENVGFFGTADDRDRYCVAYWNGNILLCHDRTIERIDPTQPPHHQPPYRLQWWFASWQRVSFQPRFGDSRRVQVLQENEEEGQGEPEWVEREGKSLADRVLFLGRPSSFAVDAARLGMDGGYAYFMGRRQGLFRYSFHDDKAEVVEELPPEEWNLHAAMWLTPQPAIAPTNVID
ncbi:unnamed protein product [Urochloa decumbens]|uniref:KIB1-4 beta-propeller domain-containing protein n=1 Tax=Urochloa decumbens TaxID=240449 RepID=A0ABC9B7H1_9POAL